MLRVTFYSYKGGVGRTLALLNVAAALAAHGRKVLAVDLDLEAPGFGLSSFLKSSAQEASEQRGVSDFIFDSFKPGELAVDRYIARAELPEVGDRLWLMPAGTRAMALAAGIADLYQNPSAVTARVFSYLVDEIASGIAPDYLLFDSRTGLADIAGVCTVELPQVLVVLSGLAAQSVEGTAQVLERLRAHPARVSPVATLLALSPIPRDKDLEVPTLSETMRRIGDRTGPSITVSREGNLLFDAVASAQRRLMPLITEAFDIEVRKRFPDLGARDLLHGLEYDPEVPLRDELHVFRVCPLAAQYRGLARSIQRANLERDLLPGDEQPLLPLLVDADVGG